MEETGGDGDNILWETTTRGLAQNATPQCKYAQSEEIMDEIPGLRRITESISGGMPPKLWHRISASPGLE